MTAVTASAAAGIASPAEPDAGPPYDFTTELVGQYKFVRLSNVAMLTKSEHGYRFRTGKQDSHLVVTRVERGIRFVDTGTRSFERLSPACRKERVRVGIAAVCRVPGSVSARQPLLVEVWPTLGDDFTDGSSLPATVALAVLGDTGNDLARLGAGPDFFNGFSGRDRVTGGAGNDWIRAGLGNDPVRGGLGDDRLVGQDGRDTMYGGQGDDRVGGVDGDDRLWGGAGADFILCGTGWDRAKVDRGDRALGDCESVDQG